MSAPKKEFLLTEEQAAENLARSLRHKEKRQQPAATQPRRVRAKKRKVVLSVDFSKLDGPAGSGQHGGGKEAPALPPTVGVKTNPKGGHGFGPQKGPSGSKKSHDSGKKSQKQKEQERKKGGKGKNKK